VFVPQGLIDINDTPVTALYRVHGNKITHVWVASAPDALVDGSKDALLASTGWSQVDTI
jgi:hypothetical protein